MEEILRDEIGRLENQIGQKFEELRKDRISPGEFQAFSEKLDDRIAKLEKNLLELRRPKIEGTEQDDVEMKVFRKFLRAEPLTPEEKKVLTVGTPAQGGYIAPVAFFEELVKYLTEASPVRKYARVIATSGPAVNIPRMVSRTGANWVAESGDISVETQPVFSQLTLSKYKMVDLQRVSWEMIRDSKFDIDQLLAEIFAEDFAKLEGAAFVNGTGSGQPYGITHATNGATKVTTATVGTCVPDDIIELVHTPNSRYMTNGIVAMNRKMIKNVRLFKADTGEYIWEPDFQGGTPGRLLGLPLVEFPDLDDTIAAGKNLAVAGDLKAGFWIVDDADIEIFVADQLFASKGEVGYFGVKRVGGGVVNPNAIAFLQVKSI